MPILQMGKDAYLYVTVYLKLTSPQTMEANCMLGRIQLHDGPIGWVANLIGIAYTIVTTVLFLFPPELPVTSSNMSKPCTSALRLPSYTSFALLAPVIVRG